jgi:hypothetical protein
MFVILNKYRVEIVKLIILTVFFTLIIFLLKNILSTNQENTEEDYIEYTTKAEENTDSKKIEQDIKVNKLTQDQKNQIKEYYKENSLDNSIVFTYFPPGYNIESNDISNLISYTLKSFVFSDKIDNSTDPK